MANEIVPFSNFAVAKFDTADLLETIAANVGDTQITERNLDRVKMPSGGSVTWEVPTLEGDQSMKELVGVVVYSKLVRAYWEQSYDDGGGNDIPDCSSSDSKQAFPPGEFVPPAPAHEDGGFACAGCALAKFGSAEQGGGQACQQKRLVFMLTEGDLLPFVVALSPTSLKPFGDYLLRLTRKGLPYWRVQTKVALQRFDDPKPHARVVPTMAEELDAASIASVKAYRDALLPAFSAMSMQDAAPPADE